jgi:hypothetical protein
VAGFWRTVKIALHGFTPVTTRGVDMSQAGSSVRHRVRFGIAALAAAAALAAGLPHQASAAVVPSATAVAKDPPGDELGDAGTLSEG